MIQDFAATHHLTLVVGRKVLGKSGSRIPGKGGYVFELTEEPGTLYAVVKSRSSTEKWITRIRLFSHGCKVKNFPNGRYWTRTTRLVYWLGSTLSVTPKPRLSWQ